MISSKDSIMPLFGFMGLKSSLRAKGPLPSIRELLLLRQLPQLCDVRLNLILKRLFWSRITSGYIIAVLCESFVVVFVRSWI